MPTTGADAIAAKIASLQAAIQEAAQNAALSGAQRIAAVAEELAPKKTFLLASTIHATTAPGGGSRTQARAVAVAGSEETIRRWRSGEGNYAAFQEFGTSNGVPALHYMANAVSAAMSDMLEREGEVMVTFIRGNLGIAGQAGIARGAGT